MERTAALEAAPHATDPGSATPWRGLALLFLLALATRVAWFVAGPKVIENEGVYYARVAENLASGRGLVPIHEVGKHLLYPPLYASSIAAGVRLGLPAETAARGLSLIFGVAFPLLVWFVARRSYGARAAWLAGVLAAVQPVLVVTSAAVLTESMYLTLSLAAMACVAQVVALRSPRSSIAGGVFLGLAYLCRPEAFILAWLFSAGIVLANRERWRLALSRAALMLAVFSVFAVPYISFLYRETGQLRFEAKTADGVRYSQRQAAGQSWGEIYFAIDKDTLQEKGATNTSDLDMLLKTHATLGERARTFVHQGIHNLPRLLQALGDLQLGQPVFGLAITLGFFGAAWDRERLRRDLALLLGLGLTLMTFCTWPFFHDRFLFPLLPALVIWGGAGLERLARWARASAEGAGLGPRAARLTPVVAVGGCLALITIAGASGIRESDELSQSWMVPQYQEDAFIGRWLRANGDPRRPRPRIMDTGPLVAFYGGGVLVPYPWTDSATALRYIEHRNIDYLIVRQVDGKRRPYLGAWYDAVPDERFELVKAFESESGLTRLYRWRRRER